MFLFARSQYNTTQWFYTSNKGRKESLLFIHFNVMMMMMRMMVKVKLNHENIFTVKTGQSLPRIKLLRARLGFYILAGL